MPARCRFRELRTSISAPPRCASRPGAHLRALRARIGMVFQSYNLWPHKTVLENVIEAPIRVKGMPRRRSDRASPRRCSRASALPRSATPIRTGFPAASSSASPSSARSPWRRKLMLFDEVTSALDPELVGEVLAADGGARRRWHDHAGGDPRDRLRPRGQHPDHLLRRRPASPRTGRRAKCSHRPRSDRLRQFLKRVLHEHIGRRSPRSEERGP